MENPPIFPATYQQYIPTIFRPAMLVYRSVTSPFAEYLGELWNQNHTQQPSHFQKNLGPFWGPESQPAG